MKSKLFVLFIITTYAMIFSSHTANNNDLKPLLPTGTPLVNKTFKTNKAINANKTFIDNERYNYFLRELVNFTQIQDGKLYDYIDPEVKNFSPIDPQLFEKIIALKHLEKPEKERIALNKIDKFLATNYRTQTVPAQAYQNTHLPKPFYLEDLKKWTFECVKKGELDALRAFLDNYNLLKIKDNEGYSLLSYAVMYNQYDIIEFLIKRKININEVNKYGASPITIAARNNNLHAVKLLVQNNCRTNHKDQFGNSPQDYALLNKNEEMYRYLLDKKYL